MFQEISKDFIAGKKLTTGFKVSKDRMTLFLDANAAYGIKLNHCIIPVPYVLEPWQIY